MIIDMQALGAAVRAAVAQLELTEWPAGDRRPLHEARWRAWGGRTTAELIARYGEPGPSMPVQLCCGMGVDTAAIITRIIEDPDARVLLVTDDDGSKRLVRIDLADITAVVAMTGDEFDETRTAMQDHLLPRMQAAGLRLVQICRAGQSQEDGVDILDDTAEHDDPNEPWQMHMRGAWALSDELIGAGTVPQTASKSRRCSYRAKGWPLDVWAAWMYGDTERIHIIGFAAEEDDRVAKDASYSHVARRSVYPLRQWGWDRDYCEDYLYEQYGIEWPRSCCQYCPYAGGSRRKNAALARRWRREPGAGVLALVLETTALALNPRMALFKDVTARAVAEQQGLTEVLAIADAYLDRCTWAIYDVQRVIRPAGAKKDEPWTKAAAAKLGVPWRPGVVIEHPGNPNRKGQTWRSTITRRTGSRAEITAFLARCRRGRHEPGRTPRLWLVDAQPTYPTRERLLVAAPAGVEDKEQDGFGALWATTVAAQGSAGQLTRRRIAA